MNKNSSGKAAVAEIDFPTVEMVSAGAKVIYDLLDFVDYPDELAVSVFLAMWAKVPADMAHDG